MDGARKAKISRGNVDVFIDIYYAFRACFGILTTLSCIACAEITKYFLQHHHFAVAGMRDPPKCVWYQYHEYSVFLVFSPRLKQCQWTFWGFAADCGKFWIKLFWKVTCREKRFTSRISGPRSHRKWKNCRAILRVRHGLNPGPLFLSEIYRRAQKIRSNFSLLTRVIACGIDRWVSLYSWVFSFATRPFKFLYISASS